MISSVLLTWLHEEIWAKDPYEDIVSLLLPPLNLHLISTLCLCVRPVKETAKSSRERSLCKTPATLLCSRIRKRLPLLKNELRDHGQCMLRS